MKTKLILLALLCGLMLTSCSEKAEDTSKAETTTTTAATTTTTAAAVEEPDDEDIYIDEMVVHDIKVEETYKGDFELGGKKLETIGDVLALQDESPLRGTAGSVYICAVLKDDKAIRALANMPEDIAKKYEELDIFDDDYAQKCEELVKDLKISRLDDLTDEIPAQEELDKFIGETGRDVLDAGYECNGYSIVEGDTRFFFTKGNFNFEVCFNEDLSDKEEINEEEDLKNITVKSVECTELSYELYNIEKQ